MALTRKFLKALGVEDEKIDQIIEAHAETVDALKEERDGYKAKAEEAADTQKELDTLKAEKQKADTDSKAEIDKLTAQVKKLEEAGKDVAKVQADFDAYKKEIEDGKVNEKKTAALEALMEKAGISSASARKLILKGYDLSQINLGDDGKIENHAELEKSIKTDYSDFVTTTKPNGVPPATPPHGNPSAKTKEEIMKIKDAKERRQAIAENPEAFGLSAE